MTPRERAKEATWDTGGHDWTTVDRERLESRVEQAINAAVLEEREACAKIVDDSYDAFTDTALPFAGPALLKAAKEIRARCNSIATEKKNT